MNAKAIRMLQLKLSAIGCDPGGVDGRLGSLTHAAVSLALLRRSSGQSPLWCNWSRHRQAVLYLQLLCHDAGLDVGELDGCWGPQTESAVEQLACLEEYG